MKLIKIEEAAAGMKVAKDVTDLKGVLLFKAGTYLSETILDRIRGRNITHIFIDTEEESSGGTPSSRRYKTSQVVDQELDHLFRGTDSSELMVALARAVKAFYKSRVK